MFRYSHEISRLLSSIKIFIFGENNSHLENILDRFFSLSIERRAKSILFIIFSPIILFALVLGVYFFGLYSLQKDLDNAASNINILKNIKIPYTSIQSQFNKLQSDLKATNQNLNIIFLLSQKANEHGIQNMKFPDKVPALDLKKSDYFSEEFQKLSVEFKLTHISLKKIMEYVDAVQQMPNQFKVVDIEIQQILDTKLYFDVTLTIEGLVPLLKKK